MPFHSFVFCNLPTASAAFVESAVTAWMDYLFEMMALIICSDKEEFVKNCFQPLEDHCPCHENLMPRGPVLTPVRLQSSCILVSVKLLV
jgi:hypothetical protein